MSSANVLFVLTSRASFSRISTFISACADNPRLTVTVLLAGSTCLSQYGGTSVANTLNIPNIRLESVDAKFLDDGNLHSMAFNTGTLTSALSQSFERIRPNIVITVADRHETIATAIASAFAHIPLVHLQGGEISGSIDNKVRDSVSKLADFHFVSNDNASKRLLGFDISPSKLWVTGCPGIDLAAKVQREITAPTFNIRSNRAQRDYAFNKGQFIVACFHSVTDEAASAAQQVSLVLEAVQTANYPAIWVLPNIDAGGPSIRSFLESQLHHICDQVCFVDHIDSLEFLRLTKASACMVGNSSAGIRECAYLGIPVVNIGSRQQGRERAENVMDVSFDPTDIATAVEAQVEHGIYPCSLLYGDGNAGKRCALITEQLVLPTQEVSLSSVEFHNTYCIDQLNIDTSIPT